MNIKCSVISLFVTICLALPINGLAHSGGTNSEGCHKDNINGGSHCHNAKDSESSSSSGAAVLLATVAVVGFTYWYITANKTKNETHLNENSGTASPFTFSLEPTSKRELDGVSLQVGYAF